MAAMVNSSWRTTALGMAAGAALVLAGCQGPPASQSAPPPPTASNDSAPPPAPDLAGGPPIAAPVVGGDIQTATMAPIPNPEDMSPQQREAVYGHRYDHSGRSADGGETLGRHRARYHGLFRPGVVATGHAPARRPAAPAVAAATPPAAAKGPAPDSETVRLTKLQTNLKDFVGQAAVLSLSDDLSAGKPGPVTLTLPASVIAQIQTEAAKEDLTQSASKLAIHATLSGDGYVISPSADQVKPAPPNQPVSFTWQVAPQAGATPGALIVKATADLEGAGGEKLVPLLEMDQPAKAPMAATAAGATGDAHASLSSLDQKLGDVRLPGFGKVAVAILVAILVLILAGLALLAAARQSQEREQERRRRARAAAAARFDEQVESVRVNPAQTTTIVTPAETTRVETHPPENV